MANAFGITNVTATWENGVQVFRDAQGHTIHANSGFHVFEDFVGASAQLAESGSPDAWDTVETNLNAAIGLAADEPYGVLSLAMDADNNAEVAALYWGDNRGVNLEAKPQIEFRARISVLPTAVGELVMGLAGDHNAAADSITESVWFKADGSGAIVLESDDTTNNNDDVASGVTVLASEWHTYRIDLGDLSDVKFYIDGDRVGAGTTFDMSNLAAAELILQPYFSVAKASGTGVGTLLLDYVRIWSDRS